ncbi:BnaC05g49770D [Brassica napus]|uniref:BnaC05g49770D protein n=1 Tax=Brassica napus TaxID=3708 RepID=A0A078J5J9_BRANA|nr:BnaC05g49770D [Brassica napus]
MTDLGRSSTLESDPLHAYSGLSLFPRTLKSMSIPPPLYPSDALQQTHTLLQSMPFEVSKEHQEQAKAILEDESSELLKQGSVGSEDTDVGVSFANKRERRPACERKRGHFTFKPTMTSESPQKEPTFDPSKYPKPGEYFAAYDRFLLAQREWQKQTGTFVKETHQYQPRPRRPELPGRKRGTYKHTYTASCPIGLKTSEKENPIPSEQVLEENTAAHVKTADREVDGESNDSTAYTDKNLENILTELLACSPDELDGDAGVKLLQERLNIKPVNEEMLSFPDIPDFPDVRRMDLKASGRNPSKPRTALSNIQNLLKGINSDGSRKKSQASPSYSPEDQFSFPHRLNLLPGDQQPGEVDITKDLNACSGSSVASDADKVIPNASPSNVGTHVASEFNISVQKSSYEGVPDTNSSPYRNADNCEVDDSITNINPATLEANVDMQTKENEGDVPMGESEANINTRRRESYVDNLAEDAPGEDARMDPFTVEDETIPYQQEESSKSLNATREQYNAMDGFIEHEEHTQGQHGEENDNTDTARGVQVENAQQEAPSSSPKQTNKRSKRGASDSNMKKRSKTVHDETEKDKQTKTLSRESGAKKQTKGKANERKEKTQKKTVTRESKMFSRRKSLAAAGTNWEAGVRRSTRIKSRPLEYWRGERFLYGRVHKSLTTVIGIKYESPGKNGKGETRALKVKSFVSDDYKELVESAALH